MSEAMESFARTTMADRMREHGSHTGLVEAIREQLSIDYDQAATQTAAQTFEARSGNCLSLVILTAAFARHFDIPFEYQNVYKGGAWSRVAGLAFYSGHVNLRLGPSLSDTWFRRVPGVVLTVDFLEPDTPARQRVRTVTEERIIAMYLNNRAAEAMVDGALDDAYWLARAALQADPDFVSAYNTLGVVYRRHGDLAQAERTLRHAVEREPANANVLSNLAVVLDAMGRTDDARETRERLLALAPYPPFHFLDEGLAATERGDYQAALRLFERELKRMPYDDELHFAIAVTELRLGQVRQARWHVSLALENSTSRDRRNIYAAKLNYLESLRN